MIMSMKLYDRLDDKQKAAVVEAGHLAQAYMRGAWKVADQTSFDELQSKFKEIITPDKQPFIDAVHDLVQTEAKRLDVEKTVTFILDNGKRFAQQ